MKKLISLCVSISLLISFSAPLQAKGHSSKGKSSSSASSSKKRSSTPKQTTSSKNSCPANGIKDSTVQSMLKNPNGADWKDYNKMEKMSDFVEKHPEYKTTCRSQLIKGVNTATRFCSTYVQTAVEKDPTKIKFCGKDSPWSKLYDIMVAVGVQSGLTSVYNFNPNTQQYEMQTGNGSSQDGVDKNKNVGRNSNQGSEKSGQGGNRNAKDNQTSRLLLNLTQEEFEKLCKEKAENLPKVFQEMAEKLKMAIENGEDIGPFIAQIAKDSSLDPSDTHYVPFQLIQMAFLMYAYSLKPNEAQKIMQYITNKREYIRYVTASAVAEVAESSIGANGGLVSNQAPVGHLKLNSTQRAQAVKVLRESVSTYKEDSMGKRLDILRLYRLDQRETAKVATVNYDSCPTSNGATVMMTLLATTGGATVAVDATGVGTGVATGGAVASGSVALPATIAFVFVGVGAYELNEAFRQGYVQNFVTGLLSSIPWPGSSSQEGTSAPTEEMVVSVPLENVCGALTIDVMNKSTSSVRPVNTTLAKTKVGTATIELAKPKSKKSVTCMYKGRACRQKNNDLPNRIFVKDLDVWINWSDPETATAAKSLYKHICGNLPSGISPNATPGALNSAKLFSGSGCGVNRTKTVAQVAKLKGVTPGFAEAFKYRDCFYRSDDPKKTPAFTRVVSRNGVWTAEPEIQLELDIRVLPKIIATNIIEYLLSNGGTFENWRFGAHEQGFTKGGLGHIHYMELKPLEDGKMYVCNHALFFPLNGNTPTQVLKRIFGL